MFISFSGLEQIISIWSPNKELQACHDLSVTVAYTIHSNEFLVLWDILRYHFSLHCDLPFWYTENFLIVLIVESDLSNEVSHCHLEDWYSTNTGLVWDVELPMRVWISLKSCGLAIGILALEAFKIRLDIGDNATKFARPSLTEYKVNII